MDVGLPPSTAQPGAWLPDLRCFTALGSSSNNYMSGDQGRGWLVHSGNWLFITMGL